MFGFVKPGTSGTPWLPEGRPLKKFADRPAAVTALQVRHLSIRIPLCICVYIHIYVFMHANTCVCLHVHIDMVSQLSAKHAATENITMRSNTAMGVTCNSKKHSKGHPTNGLEELTSIMSLLSH